MFDINGQPVKNALMQLEGRTIYIQGTICFQHRAPIARTITANITFPELDQANITCAYVRDLVARWPLRIFRAPLILEGHVSWLSGRTTTFREWISSPNRRRVTGCPGEFCLQLVGKSPASTSFYLVPGDNSMADMSDMLVQPTRSSTGEFEIPNVLPGSYDLFILATSGRGSGQFAVPDSAYTARTRIDVGNQDVVGVTANSVRQWIFVDASSLRAMEMRSNRNLSAFIPLPKTLALQPPGCSGPPVSMRPDSLCSRKHCHCATPSA